MSLTNFRNDLSRVTSINELIDVFDRYTTPVAKAVNKAIYGVANGKIGLAKAKKLKQQAYDATLEVLKRVGNDPQKLTDEDKTTLRSYSGKGGIGLTTNEYYTPQFVAEGMWDALNAMGFSGGNVLEPSAGTGVFSGTKPPATEMTNVEYDPISSKVNSLLHPSDTTINSSFEKIAARSEHGTYDSILGNPPFGDRGTFAEGDRDYEHISLADQYFVTRSIDLCVGGGLVALALPPRIVDAVNLSAWRKEISAKAEFLGAHLLPSGTFNASGTGTSVTVAIWRKHSDDAIKAIENSDEELLFKSNVYFDEFISGKYYEKSGRKFVMGELEYKKGNFDSIETTAKGAIDPIAIKNNLTRKFDSRIDWSLFATSEPVSAQYTDGDTRMINGRLKVLANGEWHIQNARGQKGQTLDATMFGFDNVKTLELQLQDPSNLRKFNVEQINNIRSVFPAFLSDETKDIIQLVLSKPPKHQDRLLIGAAIGHKLSEYQALKDKGYDDTALRDEVVAMAQDAFNQFGDPNKVRALVGLNGKGSSYWNGFAQMLDKQGDPNDYLKGEIKTLDTGGYNSKDVDTIITYLVNNNGSDSVSYQDIMDLYDGTPITEDELIAMDGVGYTTNGYFEGFDSYCTGDAVTKINQLVDAIGKATSQDPEGNAVAIAKWTKQVDELNKKRDWQGYDDISLALNSKWIDKSLILDFLHDAGYTKFTTDPHDVIDYPAGTFHGYREDAYGKKQTRAEEQFHRHFENYLNHTSISGERVRAAATKQEINQLNSQFKDWLVMNNKKEIIEQCYNDKFNRNIEKTYSESDLGLTGLTGHINLLGYQNQAIRRLAEDGKGLLGFQMGLGKTFTALGLAEYKYQKGLSKRTAIVVPKSTYENWYHEYIDFYGRGSAAGGNVLFVGIKQILDSDGNTVQIPVFDKDGKPTGKTRDKIELLDGKDINARMNMIPNSNYKMVVMTKEQFSKIPMRPESKETYVDKMVSNQNIRSTRLALDTIEGNDTSKDVKLDRKSDYQEARRRASQQRKYGREGIEKSDAYPYFESMAFDNIICDEAHNYRNSYQAGRETASIAWLPTSGSAKSALDMAIKCDYIRANNNGAGTTMLTATPNVNSPTDMFNMLSLVIGVDEWVDKYGIANVDDFIRVFGEKDIRDIEKLSGEIEPREALTGFNNLSGLRNIFHKWVNYKEAKDVASNVKIPDLDYRNAETPMSDEQAEIYTELREQADWLSKATDEEKAASGLTVFGLIRQMDKIASDPDLYHGTMTYLFDATDIDKVNALVAKLPKSVKITNIDDDQDAEIIDKDDVENLSVEHGAVVEIVGDKAQLVVNAYYESLVNELINKVKINENTVTHPIPPKYANLIENVRAGLVDGKQIIFTEEKTQHEKIRRILSYHLDMPRSEIGIINADSIKMGKKKADADAQQSGLEGIAQDFNEGRLKIVICNKKAEVGINLHRGTSDVHNLTIPWTPASLKQRAGRAARVGSTAKSVRIWVYQAVGSFDKFRFQTMKRKANWIDDIITNSDINSATNANGDDAELMADLLAASEEERQQQRALRQAEADARMKAELERRAKVNLSLFINQAQVCSVPKEDLEERKQMLADKIPEQQKIMRVNTPATDAYKNAALRARNLRDQIRKLDHQLSQYDEATNKVNQLKGTIKGYVNNGTLNIDSEIIDTPDKFAYTPKGQIIKIGSTWEVYASARNNNSLDIKTVVNDREMIKDKYIAQVKTHNQALGYAECDLLYPQGVRDDENGGIVENRTMNIIVYYDWFIKETEYVADAIFIDNVIETAKKNKDHHYTNSSKNTNGGNEYKQFPTLSLNLAQRIKDRIGETAFTDLIKANNIYIQAEKKSYSGGTTQEKEMLYIKNGKAWMSTDTLGGVVEDSIYYAMPPLSDNDKAIIAGECLSYLRGMGKIADKSAYIYLPELQLRNIFGADWFNNIISYGDIIPLAELTAFAQEAIQGAIEVSDLDEMYMDGLKTLQGWQRTPSRAVQSLITKLSPTIMARYDVLINDYKKPYDNVLEAKKVIDGAISECQELKRYEDLMKVFEERIQAEREAAKQAELAALMKEVSDYVDQGVDAAKQRLSEFKRLWLADDTAADLVYLSDEESSGNEASTLKLLRIASDLSHFDGFNVPVNSDEMSIVANARSYYDKYVNCLLKGLDPTEPPAVIDDAVNLDEILETPTNDVEIQSRISGELAKMRVKLATTNIDVMAKKGRRSVNIKFEAGSVIGIQDPAGMKGKLAAFFRGDKTAKATYQAEWLSSTEGDFTGGWWMIAASSDLETLSKGIDEA